MVTHGEKRAEVGEGRGGGRRTGALPRAGGLGCDYPPKGHGFEPLGEPGWLREMAAVSVCVPVARDAELDFGIGL
jgi:hypothetical protein